MIDDLAVVFMRGKTTIIAPELDCTVLFLHGMVSVEHLANYHIVKNQPVLLI